MVTMVTQNSWGQTRSIMDNVKMANLPEVNQNGEMF